MRERLRGGTAAVKTWSGTARYQPAVITASAQTAVNTRV